MRGIEEIVVPSDPTERVRGIVAFLHPPVRQRVETLIARKRLYDVWEKLASSPSWEPRYVQDVRELKRDPVVALKELGSGPNAVLLGLEHLELPMVALEDGVNFLQNSQDFAALICIPGRLALIKEEPTMRLAILSRGAASGS